LLLFSTLGPDTLKELRYSWQAVDSYNHVNAFTDMHDVGDALVRAAFADPVMDMEMITLTYPDIFALMRDLKTLGAHNLSAGRPRNLTGKGRLRVLQTAYEGFRGSDGLLPATYEVVYGHAWLPQANVSLQRDDGLAVFPISQLRRRPQDKRL
jgi:malonyl-CoA O-methyltransferase